MYIQVHIYIYLNGPHWLSPVNHIKEQINENTDNWRTLSHYTECHMIIM